MYAVHFAIAAVLTFTAFTVDASTTHGDLPKNQIDACLSRLDELSVAQDRSVTYTFDLNAQCPRLATALGSSFDTGDRGSLSIDAVSIEGLRDLRAFAVGFEPPASGPTFSPDFDGLDALLSELLVEERIDDSLFDRFVHWLERYVKDGEAPKLERFLSWLESLDAPLWLGELILKSSIVLIVLLALMVVGNELRIAGVLRRIRQPRAREVRGATKESVPKRHRHSFHELPHLPPRRLATAALELVTAAFVERGWLSSSSSLTNGELVEQVALRRGDLAERFSEIVNAMEQVIYGDQLPDEKMRQWLVTSVGELVTLASGGPRSTGKEFR